MTGAPAVAVLGTDTGCGKTALATAIVAGLRARHHRAGALKPVATGVPPGEAGEDAAWLAAAAGVPPADCAVATFVLPRSPLAAARAEGRTVDIDALVAAVAARRRSLGPRGVLVVEGVGGVLVPLTAAATVRDLVRDLDVPVLLAARAGLGTINHTALSLEACTTAGVRVLGVVLVDTDGAADVDLTRENAEQIAIQCGVPVLGVLPHFDRLAGPATAAAAAALGELAVASLDLAALEVALWPSDPGELQRAVTAADRAHVWHPFTQFGEWRDEEPLVVTGAHGRTLRCADGRKYLDGIGALWANLHGYGHPRLDTALREQAGRVSHATFLGQTHEPGARLAEELAGMAPRGLERVFLSESGASAVEVALRLALLTHRHRGVPERRRLVSLEEAYHGDTAGAVSVGRSEPFHRGLDPLLGEVLRVPPPHLVRLRHGVALEEAERRSLAALDAVLAAHGPEVAAVVVEPRVQGAAGIWVHSDAWLRGVAARTRACGALLVCDEVATGFGRTGDLFASTGAGVVPDILTLGKALSGGYLPISATLTSGAIFDLFTAPYTEHRTLYYGHTFTANPLACAVARASLATLRDEDTVGAGRALGARLGHGLDALSDLDGVVDVRRRGVMAGVELGRGGLDRPYPAEWRVGRRVTLAARARGVVVRPLGDVVVLNPALTMTAAEADRLVETLAAAIVEVVAGLPAGAPPAPTMPTTVTPGARA